MNAIEIMALLFALFAGVKIIVILINPRAWVDKFAGQIWNAPLLASVGSLILAAVALWFLLQSLTIVQIAAVAVFIALLVALGFAPYSREMVDVVCDRFRDRGEVLRRSWLSIVIWAAFVIWVLYALFA